MITADDTRYHQPPGAADHLWAETWYFGFGVPEAGLAGLVYVVARPGTGACVGEVVVFDALSPDRRDVVYFDSNHHLPLPGDFSDFTLANGIGLSAVKAPRDYRIGYAGVGDTELHLDVAGLMEPYDIHDRAMCPTAPEGRHDQLQGSGFGTGYSGHFDMTVRATGTLRLYGRTFDVDCVATMDHSWGPRPSRDMPSVGWQNAHFGEDYAVHAIWTFDPTLPGDRQFSVVHGYALVGGEVRGLTGGTMGATRLSGSGLPAGLAIDVTDRTGVRHQITGRALAGHNWACYPTLQIHHVYLEYRAADGRVGHGAHQESYPIDTMARDAARRTER